MTRPSYGDPSMRDGSHAAGLPGFTLDPQEGRDQIAAEVARSGWEGFETPLPRFFFQTARRVPGLLVDVGANTGFYSLLGAAASPRNRLATGTSLVKSLKSRTNSALSYSWPNPPASA